MPSRSLDDLTPDTRQVADQLLAFAMAQGIAHTVTHTLRTCDEQNALYAQGRTAPGGIVTNAPGCRSWHTHGRALDLLVKETDGSVVHNGLDARYARLGEFARSLGMKWGGDFKDYGHFEYHPGFTIGDVCPDPSACASAAVPTDDRPGASMDSLVPGAVVAALCLGAVAYVLADMKWDLTERALRRLGGM